MRMKLLKEMLNEMLDGKRKQKIFSSNMIQQCGMKCWIRLPGPLQVS